MENFAVLVHVLGYTIYLLPIFILFFGWKGEGKREVT
jgi:hypothetical protein